MKAFFTTDQLTLLDKAANSLALGTSPIVRALVDPEGGMKDVRALDNVSFTEWFKSHGGSQGSIDRMWDPIGMYFHPKYYMHTYMHTCCDVVWRWVIYVYGCT